jgi:hypothetical protein
MRLFIRYLVLAIALVSDYQADFGKLGKISVAIIP